MTPVLKVINNLKCHILRIRDVNEKRRWRKYSSAGRSRTRNASVRKPKNPNNQSQKNQNQVRRATKQASTRQQEEEYGTDVKAHTKRKAQKKQAIKKVAHMHKEHTHTYIRSYTHTHAHTVMFTSAESSAYVTLFLRHPRLLLLPPPLCSLHHSTYK